MELLKSCGPHCQQACTTVFFFALSFKEAIPFLDDHWLKIEMGDFSSWTEFENALTYLPFRFNNGTNVATFELLMTSVATRCKTLQVSCRCIESQ